MFKEALLIVNKFRSAGKQLSLLGVEQERVYKKRKVLQTSTEIRWGSQYNMLKSVNNSKEALRNFAYCNNIDDSYKHFLLEPGFWAALTQLLELLGPIHNLQKMSEDNHATVSYVYPRWLKLEEHLKRTANSKSLFAADVKSYLTTIPIEGIKLTGINKKNWTRRREKQLFPLHRIAYFLNPLNSKVDLTDSELKEIDTAFKQHILDYTQALSSFFDFRNHEGSFANRVVAWGYKKQPKLF